MNVPFLDLSWQELQIRQDRERRFSDIIGESAFVLGPHVASFERQFAEYIGAKEAVGVAGGTHAITMICRALGLREGDEVLMIPTTFMASATGVIQAGARPVFVDIDPDTRDMDVGKLEAARTPQAKAVLAVHLYGQPSNMDAIMTFASVNDLLVIEDACQAHGARYKGSRVGTFGQATAFSFYPGKNLGAYGDGGAVVTNDPRIAEFVRALRNQGCRTKYDHEYIGYNSRLDALQAAVLEAKLQHLDHWNSLRASIAKRYQDAFAGLPLVLPKPLPNTEPVWHLYAIELKEGGREDFMHFLNERHVATGIHYPVPLHRTPALSYLGYDEGAFPHAERLAAQVVSLPIYPGMNDEQVEAVIRAVTHYFHG